MKKTIILSVAAVLIIAASIGGTLFFIGKLPGLEPKSEHPASAPKAEAASHEASVGAATTYVSLDPPFTISFQNSEVAQYLQFGLDAVVQDKGGEDAIKTHGPAIRNVLVMLLSGQKPEDLQSREGKERLRVQIRDEIRSTLSRLTGNPGVADVFFTSFLMQ